MINRRSVIALIAILCASSLFTRASAQPPSPQAVALSAAQVPWSVKTINPDTTARFVNVAYARQGSRYPLVGYTDANPTSGPAHTFLQFPAVGLVGNCGTGEQWVCLPNTSDQTALTRSSNMAVHDGFLLTKVSWLVNKYPSDVLTLNTFYLTPNLTISGELPYQETVVDFSDLGYETSGTVDLLDHSVPSLAFDSDGNPHMVFLLHSSVGRDILVYAHKVEGSPTHPCSDRPDTHYQCDAIIYPTVDVRLSSYVSIVVNSGDTPYITFINITGQALYYAYPTASANLHPNCGPELNLEDKSWRCTVIETSDAAHPFLVDGTLPQVDVGVSNNKPHIIYRTTKNGIYYIRYARYVGVSGNCGEEFNLLGGSGYRWNCTDIMTQDAGEAMYFHFSLAVDSDNYPMIAYTWTGGEYHTPIHLWVLFPTERMGGGGYWYWMKVDGGPINTAFGVDIALYKSGLGLIGYVEEEDYSENLRLAWQEGFPSYLPLVRR